ncbi:Polysaccharide biosynthesis protein [Gaiella occulta]|uniref:Polysaccharide biosynthesis protein n=1 Tax=Gaiella occulta TaxID=1002870 RepID=A0A7M2YYL6_9ACTN|nr:lipopolysaccharide biosynthesis protein [Gaiella occulta]RDI74840.1 Polysaccharide biosynthesis protein [Gaiella occulta]
MTTSRNEPPGADAAPADEAPEGEGAAPPSAGHAEQKEIDRRIMRGSAWIALSYGGRQALTLISMLALVRILDPKAFGLMALATTMLLVLEAVHESGLASALVYLRSDIERAAGTALVVSILSSVVLYGACFLVAPLLADVFHASTLTDVLRVLSLIVIFRAFAIVPGAILERELNFRGRGAAELLAAFLQATVAIGLALAGAGVWSLVVGNLVAAATTALVVWLIIPWRPSPRKAQWGALRQLWRYSWFMSGANILVLANNTIDNVIVGRMLGAAQLGYYTVTYRVATMPDDVIGYIVGRVMFPVYSRLNEDKQEFGRVYVQNLQRIALLSLPASVGVIVAAEPIVLGLLGAKWLAVVTPLRILASYALVRAIVAPTGEVFKGAGKPYLLTAFSALHLSLSTLCLLVLVPRYRLNGAAIGMLAPMVAVGVGVFIVGLRLLQVELPKVVRALLPSYVCAGILALALLALLPVAGTLSPAIGLVMLVAAGICVYVASTAVFARSVVVPMWAGLRRA